MKALILNTENPGESLREGGLGNSRDAFQQYMTCGQESDEELMCDVVHPDYDLGDLGHGLIMQITNSIGPLLDCRAVEVGSRG